MDANTWTTGFRAVQPRGFTLIELLVTMAVVSVLMAMLVTGLHGARALSRRSVCQSNVRQVVIAWDLYLNDYSQRFFQGVSVNHDFAGWKGTGGYALSRPLNPYMSLPLKLESPAAAAAVRCPADGGGIFSRPPEQRACDYFGNSYQTNVLLIGPDQRGLPAGPLRGLYVEVNKRMKGLTREAVSEPALLLLVGDNNWVTQWDPSFPRGNPWHGRGDAYSAGFLDGHVEFLEIAKGLFKTSQYRVLPFKELDCLATSSRQ